MRTTVYEHGGVYTKCRLLIVLVFFTRLSIAQQMNMHKMPVSRGNVFLVMMDTMMKKMDQAATGRLVNIDFIQQMIPHHEGAIEMANYEIEHGKDFTMFQLAKSILAEQGIEVQQMKLWLKRSDTDTAKTSENFRQYMDRTMKVMMQSMPVNTMLADTDSAFARVMIPHHQAAIDMAKVAIKFTKDRQTIAFAKHIISSEQIEIEQMSSFLKK